MLRYIFMGSPDLAVKVLQALIRDLYPPQLVVTQPPREAGRGRKLVATAVEDFCRDQQLPFLSTPDVNHEETLSKLRSYEPDVILVAAFGQIFKQKLLELPKIFCLNVHASLLPKYRGASPIQRAIWDGEKTTGITVQKLEKKLDAGDILLQKILPILEGETSGQLYERLALLGGEAAVEAIKLVESGKFRLLAQDPMKATYAPKIDKTDAAIDWQEPAEKIYHKILALNPWPIAETWLGKERLKIFNAVPTEGDMGAPAGFVRSDGVTFLKVQCGNGQALFLTEVQLENRKRLEIKEFLMGYRGVFPYKSVGKIS